MDINKPIDSRGNSKPMKKRKFKMVSAIDKLYLEDTYSKMAAKGWLLCEIKGLHDVYSSILPCELEFSVTLFQPVTVLDYPDYDKEDTYQEFCEDAGWVLAAKSERYFVYYKSKYDPAPPIHTEPSEEYNSVMNVMKKGELFTFPMLQALMIFQLWMAVWALRYDSFYQPGGLLSLVNPFCLLIITTGYMVTIIRWIITNRPRARSEEPLIYPKPKEVRLKNGIYNTCLVLVLTYLVITIGSMATGYLPKALIAMMVLFLVVPAAFGTMLKLKIKRIKHSRTVNIIILVVGFFTTWALMIFIVFGTVSRIDFERPDDQIPDEVIPLTHESLGSPLSFDPENVTVGSSLMVPLSVEYSSFHRDTDLPNADIEVTYLNARNAYFAEIIANRCLYDERKRYDKDTEYYASQGITSDYVKDLNGKAYGLDMAFNVSSFNNKVLLVKGNVVQIVGLDEPISEDTLALVADRLFD